jgi:hypothetical protein
MSAKDRVIDLLVARLADALTRMAEEQATSRRTQAHIERVKRGHKAEMDRVCGLLNEAVRKQALYPEIEGRYNALHAAFDRIVAAMAEDRSHPATISIVTEVIDEVFAEGWFGHPNTLKTYRDWRGRRDDDADDGVDEP